MMMNETSGVHPTDDERLEAKYGLPSKVVFCR